MNPHLPIRLTGLAVLSISIQTGLPQVSDVAPARTDGSNSPETPGATPSSPSGSEDEAPDPRLVSLGKVAKRLVPATRPFRDRLVKVVGAVYEGSGFRPIWNRDDLPGDAHLALSKALADHAFPALYALDPIALQAEIEAYSAAVDARDLAFTIAVLDAGLLCRYGAVARERIWPEWDGGDTPGEDGLSVEEVSGDLVRAAAQSPFDPVRILEMLGPENWIYRDLQERFPESRAAVVRYSGLPTIPDPATAGVAKPGGPCGYAPAIAAHLIDRGYLKAESGDWASLSSMTPELSAALTAFQNDHGLEADGIFGPSSWRYLNINAADRYRSLSINLHRARLLPARMGSRYALVNLPCAELYLFEDGDFHIDSMRIVHGKAKDSHQTPIFRDIMQEVVFGPYWNVPPGIARNEVLPKAQADWGFLSRNRYEIVRDFNPYNKEVLRLSPENLQLVEQGRLFLRQKPGPTNALGRIKFLFPNSFHVYMHDTPAKNLFLRSQRDLSHGCIRVSRPERLGEWALGKAGWTGEKVETAMFAEERRSVAVSDPIPVYIVYLTSFPRPVGGKTILAPGRDVYDRDSVDSRVLSASIPWN